MAERLRAGVVWANTFNRFDPASPFGGYKESGFGREGGLHGLEPYLRAGGDRRMSPTERLPVKRTAKLFIGGQFPRSESGRSYEVLGARRAAARAARRAASRKDLRDAVVAARAAQPGWAGMTAYNRGQILYRVAELMEGRRAQFERGARRRRRRAIPTAGSTPRSTGGSGTRAGATRSHQALGATNPVAGPYFNFTIPEPTGVVGVVAPQDQSLLGLVSRLAPGDRVRATPSVAIASERAPLPAVSLGEVLATSDVPGGVVNILTGHARASSCRGSPATWT